MPKNVNELLVSTPEDPEYKIHATDERNYF